MLGLALMAEARAARQAIQLNSCGVINVKISRVGGLMESISIQELCRECGTDLWRGSMLESGVGMLHNIIFLSKSTSRFNEARRLPCAYRGISTVGCRRWRRGVTDRGRRVRVVDRPALLFEPQIIDDDLEFKCVVFVAPYEDGKVNLMHRSLDRFEASLAHRKIGEGDRVLLKVDREVGKQIVADGVARIPKDVDLYLGISPVIDRAF